MTAAKVLERVRFILDNRSRLCTSEGIRSILESMAQNVARLRSHPWRKRAITVGAILLLPLVLLWSAGTSAPIQAIESKAAIRDVRDHRTVSTPTSNVVVEKSEWASQPAKPETVCSDEVRTEKPRSTAYGRSVRVRATPNFAPPGERNLDRIMRQKPLPSAYSRSQFRPQYDPAADFERQQAIMQAQEARQRAMRNYRNQTSGSLGAQGLMWVPQN